MCSLLNDKQLKALCAVLRCPGSRLSTTSSHLLSASPLFLSSSASLIYKTLFFFFLSPFLFPTPPTFFSGFIYDTSTSCLENLPRFIYDLSTQRVSLCECEMRATLFVHWQIIRTIRKKEETAKYNYLSSI